MIHWKILAIYMWDTTVSHLLGESLYTTYNTVCTVDLAPAQ